MGPGRFNLGETGVQGRCSMGRMGWCMGVTLRCKGEILEERKRCDRVFLLLVFLCVGAGAVLGVVNSDETRSEDDLLERLKALPDMLSSQCRLWSLSQHRAHICRG